VDAAHRRHAAIVIVAEVGDQHLQRRVRVDHGARDAPQNGVVQRREIRPEVGREPRLPRKGVRVHHGEIRLLVRSAQFQKEVEGAVQRHGRVGAAAVHLVDDHHGTVALLQRLLEHEAGLRHGSLGRVDQEQHAVHHVHHPLDLAAEIGMAGRVHDVHAHRALVLRVPDADGGVLGQDRNTALALQVVRVHHALGHLLVLAEHARLAEQAVDEGRLAVVHMGDDGEVAKVSACDHVSLLGAGVGPQKSDLGRGPGVAPVLRYAMYILCDCWGLPVKRWPDARTCPRACLAVSSLAGATGRARQPT